MSSWLNTVGGTLYKDIMEVCFPNTHHSEAKQSTIIKIIVLVLGVVVVALVAVVEKLGTVLQVRF
jgi:Mn2+/Fe2+ NRAMP family transporter